MVLIGIITEYIFSSRSRCLKCGFTCDTQNVDYRFRLSLKVSRDTRLFGVTVFGGCLNRFFGITAGGLQRYTSSFFLFYLNVSGCAYFPLVFLFLTLIYALIFQICGVRKV